MGTWQVFVCIGVFWPFGAIVRWSSLLRQIPRDEAKCASNSEDFLRKVPLDHSVTTRHTPDTTTSPDYSRDRDESTDSTSGIDVPVVPTSSPGGPTTSRVHIVTSAFDEPAGDFLKHIAHCCQSDCEVFVYLHRLEEDGLRTGFRPANWSKSPGKLQHVRAAQRSWFAYAAGPQPTWRKFRVYVKMIANFNEEASAYTSYLAEQYPNFAPNVVFMQAHVTTWHLPGTTCSFVDHALAEIEVEPSRVSYVDAAIEKMNCATEKTNTEEGRGAFSLWRELVGVGGRWPWSEAQAPTQITWRCCATFAVKKEILLARPKKMWEHAKEIAFSLGQRTGFNFEHLWPTLMQHQFPVEC